MNRNHAIMSNSKFYYDEKGCRAGHIPAKRYVSTRNCIDCIKERNWVPERVMVPPMQLGIFVQLCRQMGWTHLSKMSPRPTDDTVYYDIN